MENTAISNQTILSLGLTLDEYQRIIQQLGREPNSTELGVFSVMWSEHCSYKSSRKHLKRLPAKGPRVVQGPGENAGVVDIGDNQVVVFKMESHNHPSFIEPYQGAATGVGGILRDIFTMGADPIMLLNSLRFGSVSHPKTRFLVERVVSGIAGYGNCFGCPTVGGEVFFHESYNLNPLVNAFCLGIADKDKIFYGKAKGVGNPVIYVGSKTGRDGIHGATMASKEFDDEAESQRPTVQVGDPFTEKLLLEACLELMKKDYLIGIQDMGAAGLTCSSVEMASRAGSGIQIDLSKVPAREARMKPDDFLLSESQERMLLVVQKGTEKKVQEIFDKWDLDAAVIGEVTDTGRFSALFKSKEVVNIPVDALTEAAPVYDRPAKSVAAVKSKSVPAVSSKDLPAIFKTLIASANLCSRKWIYRQYDHQVKINTVILPGRDAAVVRVKGTRKAIAVSTDCNSRVCHLNPFYGAQWAVAESARNLACVGAEPIGLTDCLNFGNPQNPEIMWQFRRAIEGIRSACEFFKVPVVSGNVSFYNETNGKPIYPTPIIGMVGLISDVSALVTHSFKAQGDEIILLGPKPSEALGGSEYLSRIHSMENAPLPELDLELEQRVQKTVRDLIQNRLIQSAHDCSDGGLAMALAESCFEKELGIEILYSKNMRTDALLFGEAPSRVVVSAHPKNRAKLIKAIEKSGVPYEMIGKVSGKRFIFNDVMDMEIQTLKNLWEKGFDKIIGD